MGGWNIFYGLLNFAVLAAILYFAGRKMVVKMFKGRRDRIAGDLERAQQARENAAALQDDLNASGAEAEKLRRQIISDAEDRARENSLREQDGDQAAADEVLRETNRENRHEMYDARRELTDMAADSVTAAAGRLLGGEDRAKERAQLKERFIEYLEHELNPSPCDLARAERGEAVHIQISAEKQPGPEYVERVAALVKSRFGAAEVRAEALEDPSLIGGVRLQIGDTVVDGSLSGMLRQVKKSLEQGDALEGDMTGALKEKLSQVRAGVDVYQTGRVKSLSNGICRVSGLSDVMAGELIEFEGELRGMVMDLEKDDVGVVLLGDYGKVQEDDEVRRTGRIIEVPVGEGLIGRVLDALGRPIDGMGLIRTEETRPIESPAPAVLDRKPVTIPLQTGIKAIDALVPIGRGQRELIIGDRKTGKTAIAIDTILNQKGKDVICIYVAIGQKESTVASIVEKLRENGAMDYSIVVCASASEPAPMLYIAPYAGAAIGEYFMYKGRHVLIIYDDLSKQAVAYREISLLLRRPPGREAYPGDVFYLHSRLLERAACLSDEKGGGSMTALPIVETKAGDISAYIPTNVISITDGQIFLEEELFNSGIRPAVNPGLSVSRVGGAAQLGAMKQVSGRLRMDLAQHRELEAFAQFGSDLDKATRDALNRGRKVTELLKQKQYSPMDAADQVIAIFAANEGFIDNIDIKSVSRYERELIPFIHNSWPELTAIIDSGKKLSDEQRSKLRELITEFGRNFS